MSADLGCPGLCPLPSDGPSFAVVAIISCSRLRSVTKGDSCVEAGQERGAYINIAKRVICLSGVMWGEVPA